MLFCHRFFRQEITKYVFLMLKLLHYDNFNAEFAPGPAYTVFSNLKPSSHQVNSEDSNEKQNKK